VQADIIVEQLRYGWWGSTGVETMALGKPVICYLRPAWKDLFLTNFPEYQNLPIVEATVDNFYEVLKHLLDNPEQRAKYGESSRKFAIEHFDPGKNAVDFSRFLLELK
jgi:glycosyltransferase involved in cell wall biosynthesis